REKERARHPWQTPPRPITSNVRAGHPELPGWARGRNRSSRPAILASALDTELSRPERAVRVLVADDDPVNRELIVEVCRSEGFEAFGVESGDQALEAAQAGGYDLLLLDAAMPGMN